MLQRSCMSVFAGGMKWPSTSCGYPVFWYILERLCACTSVHKSTPFFPVHEAFFMNSTLKDKLRGGEKGSLMIQTFPFCLGQGGCILLSGGLCSLKDEGFLPPTPVSLLTLLYASLPPGVIPHSRTAMGYTGEKDLASL